MLAVEEILRDSANSDFDFQVYAHPNDPLRHLFGEWRRYYQLKWAIAKAIEPQSILEIGVRYGYSAMAFLDACPSASYVGIDSNIAEFGGVEGALDWAKKITKKFKAEFVVADSQEMPSFPGGTYDLIHVDGQQDGDGTYYDLLRAVKQGRYVLVDGLFWTGVNYQACMCFLKDNNDLFDYAIAIPGYAGELLIKTASHEERVRVDGLISNSVDIQGCYSAAYYMEDCGGFNEYKLSRGQKLTDSRLNAVFRMADVKPNQRVIDAGCGRGEVSYACAKAGAAADAIDYSFHAIDLAKRTFEDDTLLREKVRFHCIDVTKFEPENPVDKVIASDLIEHLISEEVESLYSNISGFLKKDGQFIVHTFPNLWFYKYGYAKKRRRARAAGYYLSPEPRSYYERLMHINEQSPRLLKSQLRKYFDHVLVWFGTPEEPIDSLVRQYRNSDCSRARDLFAIASHSPIDVDAIIAKFVQEPLSKEQRSEIEVSLAVEADLSARAGELIEVGVNIVNNSDAHISSSRPYPIHLAYHWLMTNGEMVVFDGVRTKLPYTILPGESLLESMRVMVPKGRDRYVLQVGLVQENVAWFGHDKEGNPATVRVSVV